MSVLNSLKKATGLGLTPSEHYDRAFEKAVLLGKFADASDLFAAAAAKATAAGDSTLVTRATANAALYRFIVTGQVAALQDLDRTLEGLEQIERIGTQQEMIPAAPLLAEVKARLTEAATFGIDEDQVDALAAGHTRAADAFKPLFNTTLVTYQFQHRDEHRSTGQPRFFYHQGLASWYLAHRVILESPETAAEHMAKSVAAFRQCQDEAWTAKSQDWLERCRSRRTCWSCQREFQGAGIHFTTFSAHVTPYAAHVVAQLNQDTAALNTERGEIVLCTPCGTVLQRTADQMAAARMEALREEVTPLIVSLQHSVTTLESRLAAVEREAGRR